ncbi:hypothetical protein AB3Y13_15920 [Vibrio alginolyticus]|uniref:hypothetical protein n=1 Tax=Vibrio sp. B1FLJ16 TaxID=2751178 RepID=UPI0015F6771E|nr:hypothetical protein [Vibrio sp. B1FLJ16]MCA0937235.1 hypothetical protein [Vibrio alginolyticus]CAD7806033.1 hypothetical protein ACOMICROBIO_FLGHMIGD_01466 [Vibrio sp. B1FLJ16]CAE6901187.1 hypothetical protein ACOMICROBIO_FLGHMIGD_01466 [Vibrio sp. B1FLJ16]
MDKLTVDQTQPNQIAGNEVRELADARNELLWLQREVYIQRTLAEGFTRQSKEDEAAKAYKELDRALERMQEVKSQISNSVATSSVFRDVEKVPYW